MKKRFLAIAFMGCMMFGNLSMAQDVNVYVNNNNYNNNHNNNYNDNYNNNASYGRGYGSNIMCTEYGGFCANSGFLMRTSRVYYAPSRWKRQTLREKRLSLEANKYRY